MTQPEFRKSLLVPTLFVEQTTAIDLGVSVVIRTLKAKKKICMENQNQPLKSYGATITTIFAEKQEHVPFFSN